MRLGIDASRAFLPERTGTETYSYQLLTHLLALESREPTEGGHYLCYLNAAGEQSLPPLPSNTRWRPIPFPRLWTHLRLSWEMMVRPPDVLFVPAHVLPLLAPRRSVVTIFDLGYLPYPHTYPPAMWAYLALATLWNVRRATHLIVPSQATQKDLQERLRVPPSRVSVVYPGVDPSLQPAEDQGQAEAARQRWGIRSRYLLFVGTLQPRKNLLRLLQAFRLLREEEGIAEELVLVGKPGWKSKAILRALARCGSGVRYLGYVPREELPFFYQGAVALLFPSLYEGFGFPALEAMACGTPVVASAVSSLPEVVGEAGVLVDPLRVEEIARGILQVLRDPDLRERLRGAGILRARGFSWEKAARETRQVLLAVASGTAAASSAGVAR